MHRYYTYYKLLKVHSSSSQTASVAAQHYLNDESSLSTRLICIGLAKDTRAPVEGFPWDDLREILHAGQRMACVHGSEEILPKAIPE